jgi:hypothetical protein
MHMIKSVVGGLVASAIVVGISGFFLMTCCRELVAEFKVSPLPMSLCALCIIAVGAVGRSCEET